MQSAANHYMFPPFFRWNPKPFATPLPAILFLGVTASVMMNLDFKPLVIMGAWGNL
jgi:hypothetical protein